MKNKETFKIATLAILMAVAAIVTHVVPEPEANVQLWQSASTVMSGRLAG